MTPGNGRHDAQDSRADRARIDYLVGDPDPAVDSLPEADRATGHCAQCTDQGCPMLSWAQTVLSPALVGSL